PGQNDSIDEAKAAAAWIIENIGSDTPVHLNAFHSNHKMENVAQTPNSMLERLRTVYAGAGLNYVYIGNTISEYQNTFCPKCRSLLINRTYSFGEAINLERDGEDFVCSHCGTAVPIICPIDIDF
ncbi:MAG: AmmeMemoRadiSam system radical SAM enzyme, partial [Methanosarcinales archaeon]|nr:AmmeMemoRadiSam system radical SAM enzyme [Methanosarcinales archaeon]